MTGLCDDAIKIGCWSPPAGMWRMNDRVRHQDVLVIGYGNTLRRDDGFGPAVAEKLRQRLDNSRVRILVRQLLTVDLVAELELASLCVLVDAATTRDSDTFWVQEISSESVEPATLAHELSAATLLGLTQQITGRAPRCHLFSVVPRCTDLGEGLSPELSTLSELVVDAIAQMTSEYIATSK